MITTGSKLLIGATVLATLSAIAYGVTQDGVMGTVGLISAATALAFLTALNMFLRDSNVPADSESVATAAAAIPAPGPSVWPFLFALGAAVLAVGLVSYQAVFIIALVALLAGGAQWTVQAWAEGASADRAFNAEVRSRISNTLEFPLLGAIGVGVIVYAFSRIMLWLSKTNTVVAFSVLAFVVLMAAFLFAYRPSIKTGVIGGVGALAVVGIVAGGAAAGIDGERDIHEHETVGELAVEEGICESPEEFEADENASQTVGAKSDVAARITLTADGRLEATVPGSGGAVAPLTLPRSNPSNVIFTNESDHERRLSLDLGPAAEADLPEEAADDDHGEGAAEPHDRDQRCTTLVEEGGRQLLTLTIGVPSMAVDEGYRFFVPGVDGAELELVVP